MFVKAIDHVGQFVRPIHVITRNYESEAVIPGAATLFFVNDQGWALTCGHVADQIVAAGQLNERYSKFRAEMAALPNPNRHARRELEKKFGYNPKVTCQIKARLIGCGSGTFDIEVRKHATSDVALLRFPNAPPSGTYPTFAKDGADLKQGKFLCRLGFPFPEFTNFAFDKAKDDIDWTETGQEHTPRFPLEGMVTRHISDSGKIVAFEMSTPGLRGQSGGPAFDVHGTIWGMQFQTRHLDLDFDVDQEVLRQGIRERRRDSAFLHVGVCVHIDILKAFMQDQKVSFREA